MRTEIESKYADQKREPVTHACQDIYRGLQGRKKVYRGDVCFKFLGTCPIFMQAVKGSVLTVGP